VRLTIDSLIDPNPGAERALPPSRQGCVFTLGTFDGAHAGHARLLNRAKRTARLRSLPLIVLTFRRNPLETLTPDHAPRSLATIAGKLSALSSLGVDETILCDFDTQLASIPPDALIASIAQRYRPADWFVGFNNTFGQSGLGTPDTLRQSSERLGFRTHVIPAMSLAGGVVSSSRIRVAITQGDMPLAQTLLGRRYTLQGHVSSSGVLSVSDRLVIPAAGSYSVSLDGMEFTIKLIPPRLGPPGPPTDAVVPVGRILPSANQRIPIGIKQVGFVSRALARTGM
jgi:riboflavin kinase/FMN adenylyltransferase